MASAIDLSRIEGGKEGFPADLVAWDLGSLIFTQALMPGRGYGRIWRHLKRPPTDHWCLVLPMGGDATQLDGSTAAATLPAKHTLGFRSLSQPFEGQGEDTHVLSLYIPRDLFGGTAGNLDRVPTVLTDCALTDLLADYLLMLERRLPHLSAAEVPYVAEVTRAMLSACLTPSIDHTELARAPISVTLLERARQTIRQRAQSPTLGPDELCRVLAVSRSKLYRLFEHLGGVNTYIRRQRLLLAHAALSDRRDTRHIRQIAECFGFPDPSGFSRAFNQEFGYSPSDARSASACGPMPPTRPGGGHGIGGGSTEESFSLLLKRLRA